MNAPSWRQRLRRYLEANLRAVILLWRRFRLSLSLFVALIGLGSLVLWWGYSSPVDGGQLSYPEALYTVFSMIFFELTVPFPHGPLQILFFVVPILGLSIVAEGLIRFNLLLIDKNDPSGEWTVALASTYSGHIVVCGLGHVGYRVVRQLLDFGQEAIALERNPQAPFVERVQQLDVPVIEGDATNARDLERAGVRRAQAIIVATNDAMMNLEIVLAARELNPDIRIVLRMFDADLAQKIGQVFDIKTALSASAIAAPAFATAAIREGILHSFFLEGELQHISELIVHPEGQLIDRTVQALEQALDISIIFHQRGQNRDMHPAADMPLQSEDKFAVFASLEQLSQLERLNCPPRRRRK